jgi:hypothetical protein
LKLNLRSGDHDRDVHSIRERLCGNVRKREWTWPVGSMMRPSATARLAVVILARHSARAMAKNSTLAPTTRGVTAAIAAFGLIGRIRIAGLLFVGAAVAAHLGGTAIGGTLGMLGILLLIPSRTALIVRAWHRVAEIRAAGVGGRGTDPVGRLATGFALGLGPIGIALITPLSGAGAFLRRLILGLVACPGGRIARFALG